MIDLSTVALVTKIWELSDHFKVHFNRDLEFLGKIPHIFPNIQILRHMCNDCHLMHTSIISLKTLTIVETGDIVKRGEGAVNIISKSEYSLTV